MNFRDQTPSSLSLDLEEIERSSEFNSLSSEEVEDDLENRKFFVGGIRHSIAVEELFSYFQRFGTVANARISTNHASSVSRGFGFVTMATLEGKEAAFNYAGEHLICGKPATIREVVQNLKKTDFDRKIFVGGIPRQTTPQCLYTFFSRMGRVESSSIVCDDSGRPRGFGFVLFRNERRCRYVLQQSSYRINKAKNEFVEIKPAQSRKMNRNLIEYLHTYFGPGQQTRVEVLNGPKVPPVAPSASSAPRGSQPPRAPREAAAATASEIPPAPASAPRIFSRGDFPPPPPPASRYVSSPPPPDSRYVSSPPAPAPSRYVSSPPPPAPASRYVSSPPAPASACLSYFAKTDSLLEFPIPDFSVELPVPDFPLDFQIPECLSENQFPATPANVAFCVETPVPAVSMRAFAPSHAGPVRAAEPTRTARAPEVVEPQPDPVSEDLLGALFRERGIIWNEASQGFEVDFHKYAVVSGTDCFYLQPTPREYRRLFRQYLEDPAENLEGAQQLIDVDPYFWRTLPDGP